MQAVPKTLKTIYLIEGGIKHLKSPLGNAAAWLYWLTDLLR